MRFFISVLLVFPLFYSVRGQSPGTSGSTGSNAPIRLSSSQLRAQAAHVLILPAHCHASVAANALQMRLQNVVIDSSLLWFHLQLYNGSHIEFQPAFCRFMIRSRSGTKRKAIQSVEIVPFRRPILSAVRYHHRYDLLIPFIPFAPVELQQLVIEVGEARSGRLLILRIPAKNILHASYLP